MTTTDTASLAALAQEVFPDECLLVGDEPLAALAEKIQVVDTPRDALLTVDGGDDMDLQGTFDFLANAMVLIMALRGMGLPRGTQPDVLVHRLEARGRAAAAALSRRDVARIVDRLAP